MVLNEILRKKQQGEKQFAVLIDPEKCSDNHLNSLLAEVNKNRVDFIMLGGSSSSDDFSLKAALVLEKIRTKTDKKVVLFPGNVSHLVDGVDAVLFLSLISGRNPDYLIENHVRSARYLKGSEVVPVGYLLIDGGRRSSTELVSKTTPMLVDDVSRIVDTAIAGELLGHKMIYLEAGSGAKRPVPPKVISAVKNEISIPLIVGGGLRTREAVVSAYDAGADLVVVGNVLEANPFALSSVGARD